MSRKVIVANAMEIDYLLHKIIELHMKWIIS